jgi:predicted dehydrogenase
MENLKGAILGTGFWSLYQIPAWHEVGGVDLVACWNRTPARAEAVAKRFGIDKVYADVEELFQNEQLDFVDIITEVPAHAPLVDMAAKYKVPVICQKPMAPDYETAKHMVQVCKDAGIPFYVHENYRWCYPTRQVKRILDEGAIGTPFRGRFAFEHYLEQFVWDNQPLLKSLERLVLADQGSHQFDLARFFFGEFDSIYCQSLRVREDIQGEDVASAFLHKQGAIVRVDISFSTRTEWGHFPDYLIYLEGPKGTLELKADHWIHLTTAAGTLKRRFPPPSFPWAHPDYLVNHGSMVPLHQDFLRGLRGEGTPENTGEDNLKTVQLVFAAYESARTNQVVDLKATA